MAKNQHRNLTGDALHNPKGFDGASNGTKPVKDANGALDWIAETQLPKALDYVSAQSAPPTEVTGDVYLIDTTGTAYDINTIAWQSGNTIRISFNGTPDLSAVAADDYFITSGNGNASNDGTFVITTVNDVSDYIEITNNDRSDATDDEATDAVGTGYYTLAEWDAVSKVSHVTFDGSIWSSITPSEGQSCYDVALGAIRVFDGTDWSSSLASGGGLANVVEDTTPQLGGMLDVNGQSIGNGTEELLDFAETSSAVNHFLITNSATGNDPKFEATGDDTNIGIYFKTKGTGNILMGNMPFDADQTIGAGQDNYVLTYDNATGLISLEAAAGGGGISEVIQDTTPQLGGDLDVNGNKIVSASNGYINIEPNGTGGGSLGKNITIGGLNSFAIGDQIQTGADNQLVLGKNIKASSGFYPQGTYLGHGSNSSSQPLVGVVRPVVGAGTYGNFGVGVAAPSTLIAAKNNAGDGIFYLGNYADGVTEPSTTVADSVSLWAKDRVSTKAGLKMQVEDGTNHFFSDFSAIGGDETDAEANKTLTVKGTGTGSGTSSLKTTDSAGTTTLEVKDDGRVSAYGKYLEVAVDNTSNTLGTFHNQAMYIGNSITAGGGSGQVNRSFVGGSVHTIAGSSNVDSCFVMGSSHTLRGGQNSFLIGTSIDMLDADNSFLGGNTINGSTCDISNSFIWNASSTTMALNDPTSDGIILIGASAFGFDGNNMVGIGGDHYSTDATLSKHYAFGDRIRAKESRQTIIGMGTDSGNMMQLGASASNGVHMGVASTRPSFGLVKATAKSLTIAATETTGLAYLGTGLPVALNVANTGDGALWIENADTVPTATISGAGALYVEGGALKFRGGSGTVTTIANA